jgi:hypothetical protein
MALTCLLALSLSRGFASPPGLPLETRQTCETKQPTQMPQAVRVDQGRLLKDEAAKDQDSAEKRSGREADPTADESPYPAAVDRNRLENDQLRQELADLREEVQDLRLEVARYRMQDPEIRDDMVKALGGLMLIVARPVDWLLMDLVSVDDGPVEFELPPAMKNTMPPADDPPPPSAQFGKGLESPPPDPAAFDVPSSSQTETAPSAAPQKPENRVYPVADIIAAGNPLLLRYASSHDLSLPTKDATLENALMEMIVQNVGTDRWLDDGGQGTIEYCAMCKALMIDQTPDVHNAIAGLLADLRRQEEMLETKMDQLLNDFQNHLRRDRFDDAEEDARKALELDPNNATAQQAMTIIRRLRPPGPQTRKPVSMRPELPRVIHANVDGLERIGIDFEAGKK